MLIEGMKRRQVLWALLVVLVLSAVMVARPLSANWLMVLLGAAVHTLAMRRQEVI